MGLAVGLVVVLGSCATRPPLAVRTVPDRPIGAGSGDPIGEVIRLQNKERARRGRPPLIPNPDLAVAATRHARAMAESGRMAHRGSDGSSPFDRIERAGYRFRGAGENVAAGYPTAAEVVEGWMRSPGHRRNILGDYEEVGVGRATDRRGVAYWSVSFASPAPKIGGVPRRGVSLLSVR